MKKIAEPDLKDAKKLKPAEMNMIHFGGNHTPVRANQLKTLTEKTEKL